MNTTKLIIPFTVKPQSHQLFSRYTHF